jgi:hypothetical protein
MAKQKVSKTKDYGSYLWRGGKKIELEKESDRFTVMPSSREQLERLRDMSGVRNIKAVTNQVLKVETVATERDSTMSALRSERIKKGGMSQHLTYKLFHDNFLGMARTLRLSFENAVYHITAKGEQERVYLLHDFRPFGL